MRWILLFFCMILLAACVNNESHSSLNSYSFDSLFYPKDSAAFEQSVIGNTLDLKTFRPDTVYWRTYNNETDGKKSSGLEALLYYKELTYGSILEKYMNEGFPKGDYNREDFNFSWLNDLQKKELTYSKPEYKGNPDIFLGTGGKAKLWFLNNKILVTLAQ